MERKRKLSSSSAVIIIQLRAAAREHLAQLATGLEPNFGRHFCAA